MELKDIALGEGKVRFLVFEAGTKKLLYKTPWSKNKIALNDTRGMNIICRRHIGDNTYGLEITQARFGTSNTARTAVQTDLIAPYASYFARTNEYLNGVSGCTLEFFVPSASLPNNTYNEFGIYAGAQYYASAVLSPAFTKGTNQDVLVQYAITYST